MVILDSYTIKRARVTCTHTQTSTHTQTDGVAYRISFRKELMKIVQDLRRSRRAAAGHECRKLGKAKLSIP